MTGSLSGAFYLLRSGESGRNLSSWTATYTVSITRFSMLNTFSFSYLLELLVHQHLVEELQLVGFEGELITVQMG